MVRMVVIRVEMEDNEINVELARFIENSPVYGVYIWCASYICLGMASGLLVSFASFHVTKNPYPYLLGFFVVFLTALSITSFVYGYVRKVR